jgi:hypothetical protein
LAPYGRIQEFNENNNQSPKLDFRLPPRQAQVQGKSLQIQIEFLQPGGSTSSRAAATAVELQFAL